ncbi:MAG: hypothetical protein Q9167_006523 [Letrouitia subvulpina]
MDRSNLKARAAHISETANLLSDELAQLGLPEPSFEQGLPTALHSDAPDLTAGAARQELIQKVDEFRALLTDPSLLLTPELPHQRNPLISVHSIVRLGIAENFPPQGTTVQALATKLKIRESLTRRLLAHCATHHIYYQQSPDFFVHTAASRMLAENDGMRKWILIGAEELIPATLKTANALVTYPDSEEPEHSGWNIHNVTDVPVFKALTDMPDRAMVFAGAMTWHAMLPGFSTQYLVAAFPWGSEGELTVVDVGGGLGHVSRALMDHNPNVKCIVQDSPNIIIQGQDTLPEELRGRISFQEHDFFNEQPVKGADVYLLRLVLHDWSDKYSKMIIRALVPALKPGAKIVINDRVIPGRGEAPYLIEREARYSDYDMYMLAFQNAKERTANDWTTLFQETDPRLKLTRVHQQAKSSLAVVEITWES